MGEALKPPFAYYGAKVTIAQRIVALLPPHQHYVEPFAGSLAVLLAKPRSRMETVNDLDRELMTFWRMLRDRPADLERACMLTPHSRAEHEASFETSPDDLETARRVWVRLVQGRSNALQRRTGWRYEIAPPHGSTMHARLQGQHGRIAAAAQRLAAVTLECMPAVHLIRRYGTEPTVAIYVDPPYVRSTRNSSHYRQEMTADDDHRELAAALAECRASVLLSGYHSDLYDDLYDGWHRLEIDTFSGQSGQKKPRTEVLWCNRPFPSRQAGLFDDLEAS